MSFASASKRYGKSLDTSVLGRNFTKRRQEHDHLESIVQRLNYFIKTLTSCPICSSANLEHFYVFYGLRYVECNECGHLFGLDQINDEGLKILYSSEESAHSHINYFDEEQFRKRAEAIEFPKVGFVADYIKPEPGKAWLDIGASVGRLVMAAQQMGWMARGIDADPSAVAFAQKHGLNVSEQYITKDNAAECLQNVQIVSLLEVLEHLKNPLELLSAVAGGLASGSWILIGVPRHPSLTAFAMRAMPENAARHIHAMHIHLFSDQSLEFILRKAGFEAKAVWYFGLDYVETLSILHMTHHCEVPQILLNSIEHVQETIDVCGLSESMLVLAQRN